MKFKMWMQLYLLRIHFKNHNVFNGNLKNN